MKTILIVLALAGLAWSTNYFVSSTGTATSKTGSIGPVTDDTKCMPSKVNKSQVYTAGDTIFWSYQTGADSVFRDTGTTVFKTPTLGTSTTPVVYMAATGKHPIINASTDYSHGASWHWTASATSNYYYVLTAADGNPSIAALPTNVWVNNFKYASGTLASLQDRQSALGDLDGLGYNTVYIRRDAGNPATGTVLVEFSVASKYAWSNTTVGNGLVVDGFTFTHGTTVLFNSTVTDTNVIIRNCIFEKCAGMVNWQRVVTSRMDMCTFRYGYSNSTHTIQLGAANTGKIGTFSLNYCVFKDLRYDGFYIAADSVDLVGLNNCTFYGIGLQAIVMLTSSRSIVGAKNCIFGTCQTSGGGNGFVIENLSSVGGVIYYKNCFMGKPSATVTHAVNSANIIDSGGNITTYSPLFKQHSKPIMFAWTNDDAPTWTVLRDSLRALRDSIHLPMTAALNFTNGQGANAVYNSALWWDSIVAWKTQGNDITLHTRSHFQCSTPSCISIVYAGGEPCSLTIDTATHQLSTIVTGNEERNITICLDSAKWYYGYGTDSLIARINSTTGYTAAAIGTFSKSSMYDSSLAKITLAPLTKKGIVTKCTLAYSEPVLYNYEIRGNFNDIVTKSGITPKTLIWSVGGGQTVTAVDTAIACGLLGARENNSQFISSNYDYQNLYTLRPWATTSSVITTDTTTIITSVYQNLSYGGYTGKPSIFYEHASAATVPTYRTMMRALNRYKTLYYPNIKYLTLDSLVLQFRARGTVKDTNRYLELTDPDSADLRLLSVSALVNASTDTICISGIPNLYDMAGKQITNSAGHVLLSTLSMGAYNDPYSAVSACTLFAVAQTGGTVRQASVADSTNHLFKDTADASMGYRWAYWKARQLKVLKWTPDSVTAAVACSLSGNDTIFAYFSRVQYTLTNADDGHGTFTPATGAQDSGTAFNIVSTAGVGYRFWKWTRSGVNVIITDSSLASTSAYLKAAGTITLNDTIIHYTMTNANDGHGTFTPATGLHDTAAVFAIAATAAAHYKFTNWTTSGGAVVTDENAATTTALMTAAGTITASFHSILVTLTTAVDPAGMGTVTPVTGSVDSGVSTAITATPAKAWDTVAHWELTSGTGEFNGDSTGFTATTASTITAVFGQRAATASTIIYPVTGDTTVSKSVTIRWTKQPNTDSAYILALSVDTFKTTLSLDTIVGPDTVKTKILSDTAKWYAAKVKGQNPSGASAFGAVVHFKTETSGGFPFWVGGAFAFALIGGAIWRARRR